MNSEFFQFFLMLSAWQTYVIFAVLGVVFWILKIMRDRGVGFSLRMLFALVVGLGFGVALQHLAHYPNSTQAQNIVWFMEAKHWFGFVGSVFVGFIKMLVIPLISVCILKVILEIDKNLSLASLLRVSFFWLILSVSMAAIIGVALAFGFGLGVEFEHGERQIREIQSFSHILLNLVPSNIFVAMSKENIIAVVIFSFFVGLCAKKLSKDNAYMEAFSSFHNVVKSLYGIMITMTDFIIGFMPYAVVCMLTHVLLANGFEAIKSVGLFIVLIYVAMLCMFVVHFLMILSVGLNPLTYAKKAFSVWLFAFSSRSSVGTLPLSIATLQNKFGVSGAVANFVPSIGTTIGLNGCAGYFPAMAAIFIAHALGVEIDISFVIMVIIVAVIGSLGIAGVPGSATIALSIMLAGIGFGDHFMMLSLILAVDPIVDMARTTSNVSGALSAAICSAKNLNALDEDIYNA